MNNLLEVKIGLAKSVVSRKGLNLEFAKKYYLGGIAANMIPFRDWITADLSTSVLKEFMRKHGFSFNSYLRGRGLGYKARAKVNASL